MKKSARSHLGGFFTTNFLTARFKIAPFFIKKCAEMKTIIYKNEQKRLVFLKNVILCDSTFWKKKIKKSRFLLLLVKNTSESLKMVNYAKKMRWFFELLGGEFAKKSFILLNYRKHKKQFKAFKNIYF